MLKLIECPRDAMQGIETFIPSKIKASYINQLLKVGFDTIDFGSFVSPKAIPQMRDTAEVLSQLELDPQGSKLLAIVANRRGAETALQFDEIQYLGYPLSISETFQQRNTNRGIQDSLVLVEEMQALCQARGKELVVYISMAFGNPYQDPYSPEIAEEFAEKLFGLGLRIISLADTTGEASQASIQRLFETLIPRFPEVSFGAHFHATPDEARLKIQAAYEAGCQRFDGALLGFGGCPMAKDDLVGNIATEQMIAYFKEKEIELRIDQDAFDRAKQAAQKVFQAH
ncbi:MAG: hydroxymethylglutaryl-CoA lyase [Bacteroidota bacterium]